jgi:hypothetical protein
MKPSRTGDLIDPEVGYWPSAAARLSGVAFPIIVAAIQAGQLPAAHTADGWRVAGADLIAWMARRS